MNYIDSQYNEPYGQYHSTKAIKEQDDLDKQVIRDLKRDCHSGVRDRIHTWRLGQTKANSKSVQSLRQSMARKSALLDSKYTNNLKHEQIHNFTNRSAVQ